MASCDLDVIGCWYEASVLPITDEYCQRLIANNLGGGNVFDGLGELEEQMNLLEPDVGGFFVDGDEPLFSVEIGGVEPAGLVKGLLKTAEIDTWNCNDSPFLKNQHVLVYEKFWRSAAEYEYCEEFIAPTWIDVVMNITTLPGGVERKVVNVRYDGERLGAKVPWSGKFTGLTLVKSDGTLVAIGNHE